MGNIRRIVEEKVKRWDESVLDIFLETRQKDLRYASFDYCYNYFYKFDKIEDYEKSCAILWSYLSSWGMMRGSAPILKQSYYFLKPIIDYIAHCGAKHKDYWEIDFPYNDEKITKLSQIYNDLKDSINFSILENNTNGVEANKRKPSNTLITKTMLGVFGVIPAFDRYVSDYFKYLPAKKDEKARINNKGVNEDTCKRINQIKSIRNFPDLDLLLQDEKYNTLTFDENDVKRKYTKAKIIDMYCFVVGQMLNEAK